MCKKVAWNKASKPLKNLIVYLLFSVVTVETSILRISIHCPWNVLKSNSVSELVSKSNSSQYSLSLHSFSAISNFEIKSFVPCAYCASWTLAPIDVPLRKSWFIKALSTPLCLRLRQRKTMSLANSLDFVLNTLSATINS